MRQLIAGLGAESVDAAREEWWIGLRDAEEAEYTRQGGDFRKDELPSGRPPGAGRGRTLPAQRARPQRRRLRPPPGRGDPRCRPQALDLNLSGYMLAPPSSPAIAREAFYDIASFPGTYDTLVSALK